MQIESALVEAGSAAWREALAALRHDVYHLPEYASFAAVHHEPASPIAYVARHDEHRFLVPLLVRELDGVDGARDGWRDAVSPRGYPGPVMSSGDPTFAAHAMRGLRDRLRERGIVTAFVRLHPLLDVPDHALRAADGVTTHGHSVSIDLRLSEEELVRQTRRDHRYGIGKAHRDGYEARIDEGWDRFDAFVDIYRASMVRVGATAFWQLSRPYFADLRAALGRHVHLCVVEARGELAAAGLLTEVDGIVEYHLAGTATAHVRASPSKVLIAFARSWARDRGNRVLHLGGSLAQDDPLFQFKAGFSPLRHEVRSMRLIADPDAYAHLVRRWEARHGMPADPPAGWFPAYRKPAGAPG